MACCDTHTYTHKEISSSSYLRFMNCCQLSKNLLICFVTILYFEMAWCEQMLSMINKLTCSLTSHFVFIFAILLFLFTIIFVLPLTISLLFWWVSSDRMPSYFFFFSLTHFALCWVDSKHCYFWILLRKVHSHKI